MSCPTFRHELERLRAHPREISNSNMKVSRRCHDQLVLGKEFASNDGVPQASRTHVADRRGSFASNDGCEYRKQPSVANGGRVRRRSGHDARWRLSFGAIVPSRRKDKPILAALQNAPEFGIQVDREQPASAPKAARHVETDKVEERKQADAGRRITARHARREK